MKQAIRISTIALVLLTSTVSQATSQTAKMDSTTPFSIKLSPAALLSNTFLGGFDIGIAENMSLGFEASYNSRQDALTKKSSNVKGKFHSIGAKVTVHSNGVMDDGLYASLGAHTVSGLFKILDENLYLNATVGTFLAGYIWQTKHGLMTQLGAGLQTNHYYNATGFTTMDQISPVVEFNVGFRI